MASTRVETQITWSAAASVTLNNSTGTFPSDAVTLNVEDWDVAIQVHADNQGTPASGDVVEVYVAYSAGDLLGDTGNDYDTDEHATLLGVLDTYAANVPGEDPARRTFILPTLAPGAFRVVLRAPQSGTRSILARARMVSHRPQ